MRFHSRSVYGLRVGIPFEMIRDEVRDGQRELGRKVIVGAHRNFSFHMRSLSLLMYSIHYMLYVGWRILCWMLKKSTGGGTCILR